MDTTLAKGLAVLEWLTRQQRPCRASDVVAAFGLARSNAHRTLQTLVHCGWVVQDADTSAYRAGLRLFELGSLVDAAADLKSRLHGVLGALAQASGETIHLAALDGAEVVYLDKFDSRLPVATYTHIGGRAPAQCVATGKALLAALRPDAAALHERLGTLVAHTPHSIVDITRLQAELERTRRQGHAENREEWRLGVCGLGAPVFNALGEPVAAVGMSMPAIRFSRGQVRILADLVLACARDASLTLGWRAPPAALMTSQRRPP